MRYETFKGLIIIYSEYDLGEQCQKYYDSEMNYLGEAKAAYQFVKQCFQLGEVAVKEATNFERFEMTGGDMQVKRADTKLYFAGTSELICTYREEETTFWGPNPSTSFNLIGSDYVILKNKSEWKAPALQMTSTQAAKVEPAIVVLDRTAQELKEKYHFTYCKGESLIWMIHDGEGLLDAKLLYGNKVLGTLNELVVTPIKLIPLRNALTTRSRKRFVCKCTSDVVVLNDGQEYHRQFVFLAEEGKLNSANNNTMVETSVLAIRKMQNLADGKETIRLWFNQKNPDLEFKVSRK